MGQYYRGVILGNSFKKKKIVIKQVHSPYRHDNGAKLMEHSYVGNWYVREYENALANDFYGSYFVWVGDYADEIFDTDVYCSADIWYDKQMDKNKIIVNKRNDLNCEYKYVINFTKKEYICIPKEKKDKLIIHPLPLLCSSGNGRAGGDYIGTNMKYVGSWAYNKIGIGNEIPEDFKELKITFEEQ